MPWIYYGWTGVEAELRGEKINMVYLNRLLYKLDYYTPVLTTNEKMIEKDPETIKHFLAAASKGYTYAIDHPDDAADLLIKAVPDLDPKLVKASQKWLSPNIKMMPRVGVSKNKRFGKTMLAGCMTIIY